MPATRAKFSQCQHRGFGAYCHRCAEAERMEACAKGDFPKAWVDSRPPAFKNWGPEKFKEAAAHLRGHGETSPTL